MTKEFEVFKKDYADKVKDFLYGIQIDTNGWESCYFEKDRNSDIGMSPDLNTSGLIKESEEQKSSAISLINEDGAINWIEFSQEEIDEIVEDYDLCKKINEWVIKIIEGF